MAGGTFGGGSGIEIDPYLVEDAADLDAVRNNLSAHYKQTADIDLGAFGYFEPIMKWEITDLGGGSYSTKSFPFTGIYNGNGFKILNGNLLYTPYQTSSYQKMGLFGEVGSGCELKNIILQGFLISPPYLQYSREAGFLVGSIYNESSTSILIENCHARGEILNFDSEVGGLIGVVFVECAVENPSLVIKNCTAELKSDIKAHNNGGLIGSLYSGGYARPIIENCSAKSYSSGTISKSRGAVGGFIGILYGTAHIKNCYGNAEISGSGSLGGFIGHIYPITFDGIFTDILVIENCFSNCHITGSPYIGLGNRYNYPDGCAGFIGSVWCYNYEDNILTEGMQVKNCFAQGSIYIENDSNWGGAITSWPPGNATFLGYYDAWNAYASIDNCYANCEFNSELFQKSNDIIANFVSFWDVNGDYPAEYQIFVANSYYNSDLVNYPNNNYGTPKTTAEMKDIATYLPEWDIAESSIVLQNQYGWNENYIWGIGAEINGGFPYLCIITGLKSNIHTKINGVWLPIIAVWAKIQGEWKEVDMEDWIEQNPEPTPPP